MLRSPAVTIGSKRKFSVEIVSNCDLTPVCKGVSTQARKHGYFLSSLAMAISKYRSFFIEIMSPSNLMTVCKGVQACEIKQFLPSPAMAI